MSTCNFVSTDYAPIWAFDTDCFWDDETDSYDDIADYLFYDNVCNLLLPDINNELTFCDVECKSGYYSGYHLLVTVKDNPHDLDNDFTRYLWDLPRSRAIRAFDAEIRRVNKCLEKLAPSFGFVKLDVIARFSNGETMYAIAS